MNTKLRNAIIIGLVLLGGFFGYLHFTGPKKEDKPQTTWTYKVKSGQPMPVFSCEPGKVYLFEATGNIGRIIVNNKVFNLGHHQLGRRFTAKFRERTLVRAIFELDGFVSPDGKIIVTQREESSVSIPVVLYLTPDRYSDVNVKGKKGTIWNVGKQSELYYMGYFDSNSLEREELINRDREQVSFFKDSLVKFKAAEVPFLMVLTVLPVQKQAKILYGHYDTIFGFSSPGGTGDTETREAYFLGQDETVDTSFWLDEGDTVSFNWVGNLAYSTDGENWTGARDQSGIKKAGNLILRANQQTIIEKIELQHRGKSEFNLSKDEVKEIPVNQGDVLLTSSGGRYYVDGEIKERGQTYRHYASKDGFLKISGSLEPNTIYVKVHSRKGH